MKKKLTALCCTLALGLTGVFSCIQRKCPGRKSCQRQGNCKDQSGRASAGGGFGLDRRQR